MAHAAERGLVWIRRWRGGVGCQFRIVCIVHFSLATRVTSLRTSNKSGQGDSVTALDLMMYGEDVINPDNNLKVIKGDIRDINLLQKEIP